MESATVGNFLDAIALGREHGGIWEAMEAIGAGLEDTIGMFALGDELIRFYGDHGGMADAMGVGYLAGHLAAARERDRDPHFD